ncbi:MAG: C39 family peptidase [Coriobacteriia bacterium]|nr:C39 family peptidase [Coriobacteriia bacterium]
MRIRHALAVATAIAVFAGATPALAAGTGDDPAYTKNVTTALDARVERTYQKWLTEKSTTDTTGDVSIQTIIAPYKYFWTPSYAQEKSYFCGPASVQIIDDYWGAPASQNVIAFYLGTTKAGTDFSRVDNALRLFTGRGYVYRTCTSAYDFYSAVEYGMLKRGNPIVADVNIDGTLWDNYVYSHSGHIVPVEAFDWRWNTLRLNDPYDESFWRAGGGKTFGHRTYPKDQIAAGVMSHFRTAIVY